MPSPQCHLDAAQCLGLQGGPAARLAGAGAPTCFITRKGYKHVCGSLCLSKAVVIEHCQWRDGSHPF